MLCCTHAAVFSSLDSLPLRSLEDLHIANKENCMSEQPVIIELEHPDDLSKSKRESDVRALAKFVNTLPDTNLRAYKDEVAQSIMRSTDKKKASAIGTSEWVLFGCLAIEGGKLLREWAKATGRRKIKIKTKGTTVEFPVGISPKKLEDYLAKIRGKKTTSKKRR